MKPWVGERNMKTQAWIAMIVDMRLVFYPNYIYGTCACDFCFTTLTVIVCNLKIVFYPTYRYGLGLVFYHLHLQVWSLTCVLLRLVTFTGMVCAVDLPHFS